MYKQHLEQIKIFWIHDDANEATKMVNDFVIMKFEQTGSYPEIVPQPTYVAVICKELVETSYEPPARLFTHVNTSGIPDDWQVKQEQKKRTEKSDIGFAVVSGVIVVAAIIAFVIKFLRS